MADFIYQNQSKIIFGKNDESVLADEVKRLGAKKVLIHYGQNSIVKSGLLDRVTRALDRQRIKYIKFGGVQANPLRSHALEGVRIARKKKIDFVLAIGGGSVIDSAKLIAAGAITDNIWNYYEGENKNIKGALPLGVVLTIPAAGSEGSTGSVIKDDRNGQKYSLSNGYLRSRFAFINPDYCSTLPKEQIAYGASDILAHLMERYFSPERNVVVTDKLLTGAIQSMFEIAPKVYANPKDYQNMSEFCLLGTLAHNGMLALGRVIQAWESHPIEMAVCSGPNNVAHGAGLAVIFPAWLKYLSVTKSAKILQFAKEVMLADGKTDKEIIANGIEMLENFYKSLGLATRLSGLGIDIENAKNALNVKFSSDVVLGGYGKLSIGDIENIIMLAE